MSDSLDATAQAELVRTGKASPTELVDEAISRIEKLNPELNAVIHPMFDKARQQARSDLPDGPFRGVPMVLKDLTCHSAGDPFHEGMRFLKDLGWTEDEDTYLAAKFRAAGFVFVGRTNASELGILPTCEPLAYGATKNPWNTGHSTGGSSGGSAAAVASGMVTVAHANDGGGSIRIPASECGLVGLKPTRARVSLGPEFGDVYGGLEHEHVVTRSVRDTAAVLDVVHGPMPGDPFATPPPDRPFVDEVGSDPGSLRIGVMTTVPAGQVDLHADCATAVEKAGRLLESLGHHVEASYPAAMDDPQLTTEFVTAWSSGAAAWALDHWSRKTGKTITADDVEPLTWALAEMGRSYTAPQWLSSREWLQAWSRKMAAWWLGAFDVLIPPTTAKPPPQPNEFDSPPDNPMPPLFRTAGLVPYTPAFNVTGQPAISLPLHWNDAGLPIGVQLVTPFGREDVLLRVAAQLEEAQPWAGRTPPVSAS